MTRRVQIGSTAAARTRPNATASATTTTTTHWYCVDDVEPAWQ